MSLLQSPFWGLLLVALLLRSLRRREENSPLVYTFLIFALSFIGLGFMIFPNIIPPSVTIYEAAASPSSLVFMLTFIGFLIPVILSYNIYNYVVFRGKIVVQETAAGRPKFQSQFSWPRVEGITPPICQAGQFY
jgi:cytochrome d ubiquinol oxidase subunit II